MNRRGLPLKIAVSRLLSDPFESAFQLSLTLLDTLSDLDLYLALEGEYLPHSYYTLKQYYYASSRLGATGVSPCVQAVSTALRPRGHARPQLEFRPGSSPFARRYSGNLL